MIYQGLMRGAEVGLVAWLGALMAMVLWRLLIGSDALSGLLRTLPGEHGQEVDRTQNLAVVVGVVGYYAFVGARMIASGEPTEQMPELPDALLALVGGSQAVFLAGKTARLRGR